MSKERKKELAKTKYNRENKSLREQLENILIIQKVIENLIRCGEEECQEPKNS